MIAQLFKRFSGRHYRKFIQKVQPIVTQINEIEKSYQSLSQEQLQGKTAEFKQRYSEGELLDNLLPEAFATVKNAARRLLGTKIMVCEHTLIWDMVHYDVQLIGGIALHQNKIAEMATGEGKTLVATLALYLNALTGRNCQLVTVNDYLARRDSQWMGALFTFLGLRVGCIQNQMSPQERKKAYECHITYGTASEFGFDYLRDNGMATRKENQVQRDHYYCIVDEVDSILIDEARTPLIISGPASEEREAPYQKNKPDVYKLVTLQQKLCNRLVTEARKTLETKEGEEREAISKLLQVRMGMPKNRQLLRLMENGTFRKKLDAFELELSSDFNKNVRYELKEDLYFSIDEKQHQADLTEKGRSVLCNDNPDTFILPDLPTLYMEIDKEEGLSTEEKLRKKQQQEDLFIECSEKIHCISQLLRAYCLYERDKEYVVQEGKVHIVDENTGRIMPGRRWSEGLHQAVEAKENVSIEKESKTYATITIQNYFRLYDKLAGMTGTAETEASEFHDIYKLTVMAIPTHKPCVRKDLNDVIYKTRREKYNAAIKDIQEAHSRGQPVLVGTASVDASEVLSKMLKRVNIPHSVLNAKHHQQEAEIISRAGERGAVTIATNMAGRGTDIKLGPQIAKQGGLFVIGTERHESRRIDRQLRGRCARQGDPGASKFFVSLEDDLMRLFARGGPISRILEKSFEEGIPLEHPLLNKSIESAQKKIENQNYTIRKRLLQYDDVLNKQREVIYGLRNDAIQSDSPKDIIYEMIDEELRTRLESFLGEHNKSLETEDLKNFYHWVNAHFPISLKPETSVRESELIKLILTRIKKARQEREQFENPEALAELERYVIIRSIDKNWQDHLTEMEELRRSVSLRGYGQKDPLNEYKAEAYTFFEDMINRVRGDICTGLFRSATNVRAFESILSKLRQNARETGPSTPPFSVNTRPTAVDSTTGLGEEVQLPKMIIDRGSAKIGRNTACPCGSGNKYKKCCGKGI